MEFDPFTDLPKRAPITATERAEFRFVETCSELAVYWEPIDALKLRDRLLEPLHRYMFEAIVLLSSVQQARTVQEHQRGSSLFATLCQCYLMRKGISTIEYNWSGIVTKALWYAANPGTTDDEPPQNFWACNDEAVWGRFEPWVARIPLWPISPMNARDGLSKFYDLEKAEWKFTEPPGERTQAVRAWSNACQLLSSIAESRFNIDHCLLNPTETLAKLRVAETMLFDTLAYVGLHEKQVIRQQEAEQNSKEKQKEIADNATVIANKAIETGRRFSGITEFARVVGCSHRGKAIKAAWEKWGPMIEAESYPQPVDFDVENLPDDGETIEELVRDSERQTREDYGKLPSQKRRV
ncbi:hypothetical protein [Rhodopirellula sallentina]|uniref:Uncharacterized protein n=1 Tax=Rhodopirellula sallentina SM41 TaxID=1263870 RepID=M5U9Y6_9BACT|nr:hypothetical protein [Rhodopirellula sallentina]EMI58134.1 hypothetical protein RSSM_00414 [Rhodopirellula sallentina SM41]